MMPLYGQYQFRTMEQLCAQLQLISEEWLEGSLFSAYLVGEEQQKYYGLTLEELVDQYTQWEGRVASLTAVSGSEQGKVVRVNVHFFPPPTPHRVRYLIATGNRQLNYVIRQALTGEGAPPRESIKYRLPAAEILAPAIRTRDAVFNPLKRHFQRPTLTLHDHFHFDTGITADELVDLLNYISRRYLNEAPFHLRMETIDGDFYLHLDRRELRYLFSAQANKLLMFYLDASDTKEQWLHLRLSYHPLSTGTNAEVSIISHQAEALLDELRESLSIEGPEITLPNRLHQSYRWEGAKLNLESLCSHIQELSQKILYRIPPVAFVAQSHGSTLVGLSMYQLQQRLPSNLLNVQTLVFHIGRISTGQMFTIWLEREGPNWEICFSILWGSDEINEQAKSFWEKQWGKSHKPPHQKANTQNEGPMAILLPPMLKRDGRQELLQKTVLECGQTFWQISPQQAHRDWEEMVSALQQCPVLLVDMSFKHPGVIYWTELAQKLGKKVIISASEDSTIPMEFEGHPILRYSADQGISSNLATALQSFLSP